MNKNHDLKSSIPDEKETKNEAVIYDFLEDNTLPQFKPICLTHVLGSLASTPACTSPAPSVLKNCICLGVPHIFKLLACVIWSQSGL